MKIQALGLGAALLVLLAGCESRSISNSEYQKGRYSRYNQFRGELSEIDLLGSLPSQTGTEAAIQAALDQHKNLHLKRGDSVLLIQSGAPMPDAAMMDAANPYLHAAPFAGFPPDKNDNLATSLRMRAAQGGFPYILCYWGVLESAKIDTEATAISWVPIVGGLVPDAKEKMRINLRAIIVDVRSGNWKTATYTSEPISRLSAGWTRETTDQKLVAELKKLGYGELLKACLAE